MEREMAPPAAKEAEGPPLLAGAGRTMAFFFADEWQGCCVHLASIRGKRKATYCWEPFGSSSCLKAKEGVSFLSLPFLLSCRCPLPNHLLNCVCFPFSLTWHRQSLTLLWQSRHLAVPVLIWARQLWHFTRGHSLPTWTGFSGHTKVVLQCWHAAK